MARARACASDLLVSCLVNLLTRSLRFPLRICDRSEEREPGGGGGGWRCDGTAEARGVLRQQPRRHHLLLRDVRRWVAMPVLSSVFCLLNVKRSLISPLNCYSIISFNMLFQFKGDLRLHFDIFLMVPAGFRALGFGVVTSRFSATVINGALGTKTRPV